jgi:WD40 repeat protein
MPVGTSNAYFIHFFENSTFRLRDIKKEESNTMHADKKGETAIAADPFVASLSAREPPALRHPAKSVSKEKKGSSHLRAGHGGSGGAGDELSLSLLYTDETEQGQLSVELVQTFDHECVVCAVAFSPEGHLLATGSNRVVQVFETQSGTLLSRLQDPAIHTTADLFIRSVVFSPDALYLTSGSEDKIIRVTQRRHLAF